MANSVSLDDVIKVLPKFTWRSDFDTLRGEYEDLHATFLGGYGKMNCGFRYILTVKSQNVTVYDGYHSPHNADFKRLETVYNEIKENVALREKEAQEEREFRSPQQQTQALKYFKTLLDR